MSLWSRIANLLRGDSLSREIDEELQSHIADAIEQGRDPGEARRAFGSTLRRREESRDIRIIPWLDSLRADAVFGWRQLMKRKVTSAAAVLSLALAIGSCTSAFRLIDALLLRPLPVVKPEQLYTLARQGVDFDGQVRTDDVWPYPAFRLMRTAAKGKAELIAASYAVRMDLTYKADQDMEKAFVQYVSGWMFPSFGLQPALGRLLTENDDLKPGAHPYAVLSHDYWTRRFAQDPNIIGRTFRLGDGQFEIVGVAAAPFTGTEPGTVTDVFLPTMMHPGVLRDDWTWFRTMARVQPGVDLEPLRARLDGTQRAFEEERFKTIPAISRQRMGNFIHKKLILEPAAGGASGLQTDYRVALAAMGVLVALVLLIACANVANLMTAQASSRAREMALRVSLGAGKWRLVQLVLVESAWLAMLAAVMGGGFALWSAPFVVGMINPPDNPARLSLPAGLRVLGFGLALTLAVTLLFGLAPALRASSVKPVTALKGGSDPHSKRRMMHVLIAVQVAFCFLVLFVAGLFEATFERLSHRPTGFAADGLLTLDVVAQQAETPPYWDQVAARLRTTPGVQRVALSAWALLNGQAWNGFPILDGAPPDPSLAYFLKVSPGWMDAMKIQLITGRDFRHSDTSPGVAMINETFAKQFFHGTNPIGHTVAKGLAVYQVVGVVRDAPYRNVREAMLPVVFVPLQSVDAKGAVQPFATATFAVRTAGVNSLALASILRRVVPQARAEFRVSQLRSQAEVVRGQTVRERLLAMLALFFATVSLLLAGIGLYGVLDYSVLQRRKEIGIRVAIGAQPSGIARLVATDVLVMVAGGAMAGVVLGLISVRYIETLFYQVKATDPMMLALPSLMVVAAALVAALPAVVHAVRIDPVTMLRSE
jgi:putative ABC transport system permease protein